MTSSFPRLVPLVRKKNRPTCVLLPGLGGGMEPYLRLAGALDAERDVYAVRAAGLVRGERPETTIAAMADAVRDAIDAAHLAPDLIIGWSLGGVVGWEVCAGTELPLVMVDSVPCPWVASPDDRDMVRGRVIATLGERADPATVELVLGTVDAHIAALASHTTSEHRDGPVLLVTARGGENWRGGGLAHWHELAPQIRVTTVDAGHFDILGARHLPAIVEFISDFIAAQGVSQEVR